MAVADPDRSHSDRGNSFATRPDRGDDYRRGNDNSRKGGEDHGDGSAERGSVESSEVQFGSGPVDLADVAESAPSLAAGKSGDGDGDGNADPGSSRVDVADVRVGAKPHRRLGRIAFEWTRRERIRRVGVSRLTRSVRLLSSRCPEGAVQSAALDARQRAHARHPARRVRTAIAGPGTATGARCAAALRLHPRLRHRRRRGS